MVRIASHVEDEEALDCSSPIERVRVDHKVDASRSKHSETEQRRRSKINERFQILRDLIPPDSEQKRDKASLLLEVIQYIQFLQEKLQMYEGTDQGWSPEPTKLAPWKINSGPVESFLDQTQLQRHIYGNEDNSVLNPLHHVRNSSESELIGSGLYKSTDNAPIAMNQPLLNLPTQAATFEGMSGQPNQESFPDAEHLTQLSQSQSWRGRSCVDDYSIPICNTNESEPKCESGEASQSSVYSQLILSCMKNALQSSGVDLSQASISVQLDVGKHINDRITMAKFRMKDNQNPPALSSVASGNEHPHKRFRVDES